MKFKKEVAFTEMHQELPVLNAELKHEMLLFKGKT